MKGSGKRLAGGIVGIFVFIVVPIAAITAITIATSTPPCLAEESKAGEPEYSFRNAGGQKAFEDGKTHFEEKNWKKALSSFKKARRAAKGGATKRLVER